MENDFKVVRTYNFRKGTSGRCLVCNVFLPEAPPWLTPSITITIELNGWSPKKAELQNVFHVWSAQNVPVQFVLEEIKRFIVTFNQMYEL